MTKLARDPSVPPPAAPLRVFIADDSRIVHRYLGLALDMIPGTELAGRAFNTGDAVTRVRELQPDVLILDIEMPTGSGLDVLKALSADAVRPLTFVLTLYASPVLSQHCLELGADRFFDKENGLPQLLDVIDSLAQQPSPRRLRAQAGEGGVLQPATPSGCHETP